MKIEEIKREPSPLLIVDNLVAAWHIYYIYNSVKEQLTTDQQKEALVKSAWAYLLNYGLSDQIDWKVVVISDLKDNNAYWRHILLKDDQRVKKLWESQRRSKYQGYKSGRREKTSDFLWVVNLGKDYARKYMNFIEVPGFEGDDIAGSLYRFYDKSSEDFKKRDKFFFSIDSDWLQLVDEDRGFYFACLKKCGLGDFWRNQIKDNDDILEFCLTKTGHEIEHPKDYANVKSIVGDSSDSLPRGCPKEYITLSEPHPVYNIDHHTHQQIEFLNDPKPNTNKKHLNQSEAFLKKVNVLHQLIY